MRKNRITRTDVLYLSISFFVLVVLWLIFSLYHSWVTTTITPDLQIQIIPISGKFDTKTIDALKTRSKISPDLNSTETPVASTGAEENLLDFGPTDTPLDFSGEPTSTPIPAPTIQINTPTPEL